MNLACERQNEEMALTLSGELTIERAEELKSSLLERLQTSDSLTVDAAGVTSIDISCLQLLYATCLSAEEHGKRMTIIDSGSGLLETAMRAVGWHLYGDLPFTAAAGK